MEISKDCIPAYLPNQFYKALTICQQYHYLCHVSSIQKMTTNLIAQTCNTFENFLFQFFRFITVQIAQKTFLNHYILASKYMPNQNTKNMALHQEDSFIAKKMKKIMCFSKNILLKDLYQMVIPFFYLKLQNLSNSCLLTIKTIVDSIHSCFCFNGLCGY